MKKIAFAAIGALLLFVSTGCANLDYALGVTIEEFRLLNSAVPIETALETDPDLTDDQRAKLLTIIGARDYAENIIGLDVGTSFRNFVNLHGEALSWNLSASYKDRLEPYFWDIPIIGAIPYIGFFHYDQAIQEREELLEQNLDTFVYEVDAFSTLGVLPDPVFSSLLERSDGSLIDTVIHESLHNTVWSSSDVTFNESLATFVGRTGTVAFLATKHGPESTIVQDVLAGYEDSDRFSGYLRSLRQALIELYAQDLSYEETIAQREAVFAAERARFAEETLPLMNRPDLYAGYAEYQLNNAFVLVNARYNSDQSLFEAVYEGLGRDWSAALSVFAEAANQPDPTAFLQSLLSE